jgi:hypothetical protein
MIADIRFTISVCEGEISLGGQIDTMNTALKCTTQHYFWSSLNPIYEIAAIVGLRKLLA